MRLSHVLAWVGVVAMLAHGVRAQDGAARQFAFGGDASAAAGGTVISPDKAFSREVGHGFDLGSRPVAKDGAVTSDRPFFFSVAVPEGNHVVTVTLGGSEASDTTVKAESRRLMVHAAKVPAEKVEVRSFVVNVRTPALPGGGQVKLKPREVGDLRWDEKLTLEFSGPRPMVRAVEVRPAPAETVTVYVAGDSTVADQANEPYNSWGQMLPRFFKAGVAVANYAESGESLKSFTGARRIDKIMSAIRPGDYLLVQFGHNDQKDKAPGAGAFTTYADALRKYVAMAREKQATPVLITPVSRRSFGRVRGLEGRIENNLGDFPEAVRRVAREAGVPLVDLNVKSILFYEAMGPERSKQAFAPGDNTHHNNYGSYELARCVVEGIRQAKLDLAEHLADDARAFDPARPNAIEAFDVPASPPRAAEKPEGN